MCYITLDTSVHAMSFQNDFNLETISYMPFLVLLLCRDSLSSSLASLLGDTVVSTLFVDRAEGQAVFPAWVADLACTSQAHPEAQATAQSCMQSDACIANAGDGPAGAPESEMRRLDAEIQTERAHCVEPPSNEQELLQYASAGISADKLPINLALSQSELDSPQLTVADESILALSKSELDTLQIQLTLADELREVLPRSDTGTRSMQSQHAIAASDTELLIGQASATSGSASAQLQGCESMSCKSARSSASVASVSASAEPDFTRQPDTGLASTAQQALSEVTDTVTVGVECQSAMGQIVDSAAMLMLADEDTLCSQDSKELDTGTAGASDLSAVNEEEAAQHSGGSLWNMAFLLMGSLEGCNYADSQCRTFRRRIQCKLCNIVAKQIMSTAHTAV